MYSKLVLIVLLLPVMPLRAQTIPNINYIHDAAGQLVGSIDANGNAKAYTYDGAGRLIAAEKLAARGAVDILFLDPPQGVPAPAPGTPVTIYGLGFSAAAGENQVKFNGVTAAVESATARVIKTRVPDGARTGPVQVTTPTGTATSRGNFFVPFKITSIAYTRQVPVDSPSGAMTIRWSGSPVFPLTVISPYTRTGCPDFVSCGTVVRTISAPANPLVVDNFFGCGGRFSGQTLFMYEVILRDATGNETEAIPAPWICLGR